MRIDDLMTYPGEDIFYDPDFRVVLDSCMTYIRNLPTTKLYILDPQQVYKHEGDLYGLLDEMHIPKQYHYSVMRINGYTSTYDLMADTTTLILPDFTEIDLIASTYKTRNKII